MPHSKKCWHSISKCRICLFVPIFRRRQLLKAGMQWSWKVERGCPPCSGSASAPSWLACAGESSIPAAFWILLCFGFNLRGFVESCLNSCSLCMLKCAAQNNLTCWIYVEHIELNISSRDTYLMLLLVHLHCANCLLQAALQVPSRPAAFRCESIFNDHIVHIIHISYSD